jgi:hypothetical protein
VGGACCCLEFASRANLGAMDVVAFVAAILEIVHHLPPRRVTVRERYEMKKKVRELQRREREQKRRG